MTPPGLAQMRISCTLLAVQDYPAYSSMLLLVLATGIGHASDNLHNGCCAISILIKLADYTAGCPCSRPTRSGTWAVVGAEKQSGGHSFTANNHRSVWVLPVNMFIKGCSQE